MGTIPTKPASPWTLGSLIVALAFLFNTTHGSVSVPLVRDRVIMIDLEIGMLHPPSRDPVNPSPGQDNGHCPHFLQSCGPGFQHDYSENAQSRDLELERQDRLFLGGNHPIVPYMVLLPPTGTQRPCLCGTRYPLRPESKDEKAPRPLGQSSFDGIFQPYRGEHAVVLCLDWV